MLTCGCPIQPDAPEPFTHKDIAGFVTLSTEVLRRKIVARYMSSAFNNCRNQNLKTMCTEQLLQLFVDPNIKHVAIHKAAVIPIHLKAAVKADLDTDVGWGFWRKSN